MDGFSCPICPICFDELDKNNICKLECGHTFHNECILSWFKNRKSSHPYSIHGKSVRVCPYCRIKVSHINLPNETFPIKLIHKEFNKIEEFINNEDFNGLINFIFPFYKKNCCKALLEKGASAGQQCKKNKILNSDYCKIHSKKYQNIKLKENTFIFEENKEKFYPVLNFSGLNFRLQSKIKKFLSDNTEINS